MKARESVLRAKRFEADEMSRKVQDLEQMIHEFERMAYDLECQVKAEEERTGVRDTQHFAYSTFARSAEQRRQNLLASVTELQEKLDAAAAERDDALAELNDADAIRDRDDSRNQRVAAMRDFLGGFDFRGVSPRGVRNDNGEVGEDPVGGDWSFFLGIEYEHPLLGTVPGARGRVDAMISAVFFLDTGTVQQDFGFDQYRASIGTGLRVRVPQLTSVPLAFDFAYPLLDEEGDDRQVFSFSVDLPF